MKENKFLSGWIVMAIAFVLPYTVTGQISKSLSYSMDSIRRTTVYKRGAGYEQVQMSGAFRSYDAGEPDLPVFYYKFYVPKGKKVTGATFTGTGQSEVQLNADLLPAQHPVRISRIGIDTAFDVPDPTVYGKDANFPENQAKVLRSDFVDYDMEIVTVALFPMQYNPKHQKISLATGGTLNLTLSPTLTMNPVSAGLSGDNIQSPEMTAMVKTLVQNPQDVPATTINISKTPQTNSLKFAQQHGWNHFTNTL